MHVTGSQLTGNENSSSDEPLMRPQDQIEADVRRVLGDMHEIQGRGGAVREKKRKKRDSSSKKAFMCTRRRKKE